MSGFTEKQAIATYDAIIALFREMGCKVEPHSRDEVVGVILDCNTPSAKVDLIAGLLRGEPLIKVFPE